MKMNCSCFPLVSSSHSALRWAVACSVSSPDPVLTSFAAWSSVTWSWRRKWWVSMKSWTRRGRSTPWRRSSCATPSGPRTTRSGEIRCCRKRWSSFSPRLVTSLQLATPQPQTPADQIVTTPSGYSEGRRGTWAETLVKTGNGLLYNVKITRAPNRIWLLVVEGKLGSYVAKVYGTF